MKKYTNIINKLNLSAIAIVLTILIIIAGGSYALVVWSSSDNTKVSVRIGDYAKVVFNKGNDISVNNPGPVFYYNKGEKTDFSITNYSNSAVVVHISLDITTLSDALKSTSFKYAVETSTDNVNFTKVDEGDFLEATTANTHDLTLSVGQYITTNSTIYFNVYFYIDANILNSVSMQAGSFVGKINVDVNEYAISYLPNGGTGMVTPQLFAYGDRVDIATNNFVRDGYIFKGWSTRSDNVDDGYNWTGWGGTWTYTNGRYGINNNHLVLYARWQDADLYTVIYAAGGGTGTVPPTQTIRYGETITIPGSVSTLSKRGHTFKGWYDPTNVSWTSWSGPWSYRDGIYGISGNVLTLTAQWTPITYTVKYDCGGGSNPPASQTIVYGNKITIAANTCTKSGYTFSKWKDPSGDTSWTNWSGTWSYVSGEYGITSSNVLTLTAQWVAS